MPHSSANTPLHSPGARMYVGVWTFILAMRWRVYTFGHEWRNRLALTSASEYSSYVDVS